MDVTRCLHQSACGKGGKVSEWVEGAWAIATQLHVSRKSVWSILSLHRRTQDVTPRKSGRPRKTTARQDRLFFGMVRRGRQRSAASLKFPLHRAATFVAHLNDQKKLLGRSVVAEIQKILFLCNCCITNHVPSLNDQRCCSSTTGRTKKAKWRQNHCQGGSKVTVVAEWRHSGRHSDRSMDANGRPKEAHWWYTEGRSVAQIDAQCSQQYDLFTRRPMADHCASILLPRRCVCLPPASFERPLSDRPPRRPLCDCFEHAQNFTATMASMAMSERPVYHPWTTKANVRPPFLPSTATWPVLWSHKGGTKVAASV